MAKILSNQRVFVNEQEQFVKNGEVDITASGYGEDKLVVASAGAGTVVKDVSNDYSTAITKFTFKLNATNDNVEKISGWKNKASQGTHIIRSIDMITGLEYILKNGILANDPEVGLKSEGEITLEWEF